MSAVDFYDQLDFAVDPDADPIDLDEVLAEFLLRFVREEKNDSTE